MATQSRDTGAEGTTTLGIDIGASKTIVALVDVQGTVVHQRRIPTRPERGVEAVITDIVTCAREAFLSAGSGAAGAVGVGVAGQVDPSTGVVDHGPNLGWTDVPLGPALQRALGLPVAVLNDVQAATYGEHVIGAGRGVREMSAIFVGTGIGGGIITAGTLMAGASGNAGEIGHVTVDLRGPLCRCGNRGCVESFAGGWAIARRARELATLQPGEANELLARAGGELELLTAAIVAAAARDGELLARRIVHEAGEALGAGVASIVNALNPALILFGGGVIAGLPVLVEHARTIVATRALPRPRKTVVLTTAALGADSVSVGAALWARAAAPVA